ncbi:hypothetical protein [Marichromatium bheemlicum]|uniref:DUF5666 domain-containing protein n=1 Tax=Marichromatium bheemlicum TaxID=365339 RepID=A0ABX1IAZ6_9GAMM|nr:hypothetical protein [Marichromatium bheemlicum]NKN34189.1 hypothetical protein [Marichromatium bheemlicum]
MRKRPTPFHIVLYGALLALVTSFGARADVSASGVVERVWDDGFLLDTGTEILDVEIYSLRALGITPGIRVTIAGDYDDDYDDDFDDDDDDDDRDFRARRVTID